MRRKTIAFIGCLLLAGPTAALAQQDGSSQDQLACTPDVYRLCSSFIPDETAIVSCLNKNKASLSAACKQVMARPAKPSNGDADDDTD